LISSFLICIPCISFSCLIALGRNSSTILDKSGVNILVLFLALKEVQFSPFSTMLTMLVLHSLYYFSFLVPLDFLSWEMLNFVKGFFCIYWDYHVIFVLNSVYVFYCLLIYICWTILACLEWNQLDNGVWTF
jgi:hypothetical protein